MPFPVRRALGRAGLIAAMIGGGVAVAGLPAQSQDAPSRVVVVHNAPVPNEAIGDQTGTVTATPAGAMPASAYGGASTSPDQPTMQGGASTSSEAAAAPDDMAAPPGGTVRVNPGRLPPDQVTVVHNAPVPNDSISDQTGTVSQTPASDVPGTPRR